MRKTSVLIPEDMYKSLSKTTMLNDVLKLLFSDIHSLEQYQYLADSIIHIRETLMEQQKIMLSNVRQSELNVLPIHLIRDKASSSGGTFLRWRSFQSARTGEAVWMPLLREGGLSSEQKQALVSAEKERILINLQISVLNFILRQVMDAIEKNRVADERANH